LSIIWKLTCKFSETYQEITRCVPVLLSHYHWLHQITSFPLNFCYCFFKRALLVLCLILCWRGNPRDTDGAGVCIYSQ